MRSGVHALISLDGAPVAARDAARLGLAASDDPITALGNDVLYPHAAHADMAADHWTILLGYIADSTEMARSLALADDALPLAIARAAWARWGAETARKLRGEWTLLDWTRRETVLLRSVACRDPVLYAHRGAALAIAPDLDLLSRLSWVGRTIDPLGFGIAVGRQDVRRAAADRTMLEGVRQLRTGECLRFSTTGLRAEYIAPLVSVVPFRGDFDTAMQDVDILLRHSMRERLAQASGAAVLLSGGLDSSLIALLAAEERSAGQPLVCLSSATDPASGIRDETGFAQIVADRLGLPLERVVPAADLSPYRPCEAEMQAHNGPSLSPYHYVFAALDDRSAALGLPLILDGGKGEWTVTSLHPLTTVAGRARRAWHRVRRGPEHAVTSLFNVRFVAHGMTTARDFAREVAATRTPAAEARSPRARWGYLPAVEKILDVPTGGAPSSRRHEYPFRDVRLLELFAAFPAAFIEQEGLSRAPARHLMRGRLPDSIRLRQTGMPFAPDYRRRLQAHAPAARARIPVFRAAGLDAWIDCAWLAQGLEAIAAQGVVDLSVAFEVQLTAMAAEYLLWWQGRL